MVLVTCLGSRDTKGSFLTDGPRVLKPSSPEREPRQRIKSDDRKSDKSRRNSSFCYDSSQASFSLFLHCTILSFKIRYTFRAQFDYVAFVV